MPALSEAAVDGLRMPTTRAYPGMPTTREYAARTGSIGAHPEAI
jgi:hypothetical protein